MSNELSIVLEVVGPLRGKTFDFRNYSFVEGKIRLRGPAESVLGACDYLRNTQQAYPVGSEQLAEAVRRIHGDVQVHPEKGSGNSEQVLGGGAPVPGTPPSQDAPASPGAAATEAGPTGVLPGGNGPGRPPVAEVKPPAPAAPVTPAVGRPPRK